MDLILYTIWPFWGYRRLHFSLTTLIHDLLICYLIAVALERARGHNLPPSECVEGRYSKNHYCMQTAMNGEFHAVTGVVLLLLRAQHHRAVFVAFAPLQCYNTIYCCLEWKRICASKWIRFNFIHRRTTQTPRECQQFIMLLSINLPQWDGIQVYSKCSMKFHGNSPIITNKIALPIWSIDWLDVYYASSFRFSINRIRVDRGKLNAVPINRHISD